MKNWIGYQGFKPPLIISRLISPDSFTKAFQKFHGVTQTQVRNDSASLKFLTPIRVHLSLEGGERISKGNFHIQEPAMRLTRFGRQFTGSPNSRGEQNLDFACNIRLYQYLLQGMARDCNTTTTLLQHLSPEKNI